MSEYQYSMNEKERKDLRSNLISDFSEVELDGVFEDAGNVEYCRLSEECDPAPSFPMVLYLWKDNKYLGAAEITIDELVPVFGTRILNQGK